MLAGSSLKNHLHIKHQATEAHPKMVKLLALQPLIEQLAVSSGEVTPEFTREHSDFFFVPSNNKAPVEYLTATKEYKEIATKVSDTASFLLTPYLLPDTIKLFMPS